jgi:hypothetical protein
MPSPPPGPSTGANGPGAAEAEVKWDEDAEMGETTAAAAAERLLRDVRRMGEEVLRVCGGVDWGVGQGRAGRVWQVG